MTANFIIGVSSLFLGLLFTLFISKSTNNVTSSSVQEFLKNHLLKNFWQIMFIYFGTFHLSMSALGLSRFDFNLPKGIYLFLANMALPFSITFFLKLMK